MTIIRHADCMLPTGQKDLPTGKTKCPPGIPHSPRGSRRISRGENTGPPGGTESVNIRKEKESGSYSIFYPLNRGEGNKF
jgi:hypothetical protein